MFRVIVKEFPNDLRLFDFAIPKEQNKKEATEYATKKKVCLLLWGILMTSIFKNCNISTIVYTMQNS